MSEIIPKKPLLFGLFATKPHNSWAISAIVSVFIATGLDNSLMIVRTKKPYGYHSQSPSKF